MYQRCLIEVFVSVSISGILYFCAITLSLTFIHYLSGNLNTVELNCLFKRKYCAFLHLFDHFTFQVNIFTCQTWSVHKIKFLFSAELTWSRVINSVLFNSMHHAVLMLFIICTDWDELNHIIYTQLIWSFECFSKVEFAQIKDVSIKDVWHTNYITLWD